MTTLIWLRFLMGLGLGAEIVVGYATLAEFVPPNSRGRWLSFMAVMVVSGLPITALLGYLIIPAYGWRPMFAIAGVGALIVWYLRKALPESPRWLEAQGRAEEAETLMHAIEQEAASAGPLPLPAPPSTGRQIQPRLAGDTSIAAAHDRGELGADHGQYVDLRVSSPGCRSFSSSRG